MKIGNPQNEAGVNLATENDLPTKTSDLQNDSNFIGMPSGGSDGQTLIKSGNSVQWGNPPVQITVDSELSSTSENPVQNKVIKAALDEKGSGGIFYQNVFQSESTQIYLDSDYPIYQYTLSDSDRNVTLYIDNIDLTKGCITVELQLIKPSTNTNSVNVNIRNNGTSSTKTVKWLDATQSITTQGTYSIVIRTFDGQTWYANIAYLI